MDTYMLDASKFTDKKNSHEYLKEALNLPDYYGKNLDALHDCLAEKDVRIVIVNLEKAGEYFFKCYPVLHKYAGAIII